MRLLLTELPARLPNSVVLPSLVSGIDRCYTMISENSYCDFLRDEEFSGNRQALGRSATPIRAEFPRHRQRSQMQAKLDGQQTLAGKPNNLHDWK